MAALCRILLVEDAPDEWRLALSSLAEEGLMGKTTVVKDACEALDFLHARGAFRHRSAGFPAVVILGPTVKRAAALALLADIRTDENFRRIPVVIVARDPDDELIQTAYEHGVNGLVCGHEDPKVHMERYAALGLFWGWANEPPPECLPLPKSQRRGR